MAEISRPWGGNLLGDCGRYEGAEWSERLGATRLDTNQRDDRGPIAGAYEELLVEQTLVPSMAVLVSTGAALVQIRMYFNTTAVTLPIAANATGIDRYDRVVLRTLWLDSDAGTTRLVVLQGTPGGAVPSLTQIPGTQYEIALASILVASGAVAINTADITDERSMTAERRFNFGFSNFVTDPVWQTATVDGAAGYGMAWRLDLNKVIETSWVIPDVWGETPMAVGGHLWCFTVPPVVANVYALSYAHGAAAANLPLWGTVTPAGAVINRMAVIVTNPLVVTPGEVLSMYIQNTIATALYILGMDLLFRRQ